ncbi:hypothetical protein DMP16_06545 [Sulfolobus sp. B1]|nr:hypothetical protein DMP16_06545 [Sulfolobus sp. B1]
MWGLVSSDLIYINPWASRESSEFFALTRPISGITPTHSGGTSWAMPAFRDTYPHLALCKNISMELYKLNSHTETADYGMDSRDGYIIINITLHLQSQA